MKVNSPFLRSSAGLGTLKLTDCSGTHATANGWMPYLDGLACIQVLTLVGALQHVGQHDSLHMRSGQLQQVVQALVPGLEGTQLAGVLAQPHRHCVQQPCCAVPAHSSGLLSSQAMARLALEGAAFAALISLLSSYTQHIPQGNKDARQGGFGLEAGTRLQQSLDSGSPYIYRTDCGLVQKLP